MACVSLVFLADRWGQQQSITFYLVIHITHRIGKDEGSYYTGMKSYVKDAKALLLIIFGAESCAALVSDKCRPFWQGDQSEEYAGSERKS